MFKIVKIELYCADFHRVPLRKWVVSYDPSFFWWKIPEFASKSTTPLFIAAISTLFEATRYLGKMKKNWKKRKNIKKMAYFSSKYMMNLFLKKHFFEKVHKKRVFNFSTDLWILSINVYCKIFILLCYSCKCKLSIYWEISI